MGVVTLENPQFVPANESTRPSVDINSQDSKGPLYTLYRDPYRKNIWQYPRDLDSNAKGHSVQFEIFQTNAVTLQEFKSTISNIGDQVTTGLSAVKTAVVDVVTNPQDAANKLQAQVTDGINNLTNGTLIKQIGPVGTRVQSRKSDTITLYMPETLEFHYGAQYDSLSLADAAGSLPGIGGISRAITSTIDKGGNAALRLALNYAGYVFNPQQQLMFEGIDFRTYNMAFTFTPYSRAEADAVQNIIKTFRQNAAPEIVTSLAGFFFNPPSLFDVKFMYQGQQNTNINKLKRSVLESVDVNYAPNGWSAHEDGAPVQTTMTLQFREIELVDKVAIERDGY
jgi:hypothetical protein